MDSSFRDSRDEIAPLLSVRYYPSPLALTPFPTRGFRYFASASRATADRSRELRRPPARPASTHTSLPHPRRKLLAMWPVRAARLPHLDMLPEVVWAGAQRQRPYDKDVLKNKDFFEPPTLQHHSLGPPAWPERNESMRVRTRGLWMRPGARRAESQAPFHCR